MLAKGGAWILVYSNNKEVWKGRENNILCVICRKFSGNINFIKEAFSEILYKSSNNLVSTCY